MNSVYENGHDPRCTEAVSHTSSEILRHIGIFGAAAAATGVILYLVSMLGVWINGQIIPGGGGAAPEWVYSVFLIFFCLYLIGIVFPFLLFLGWRHGRVRGSAASGGIPMVSVVIPAYNEARTIERSIQGVLEQDYPNLEVIVVDDGSRDLTPFLAKDRRVTYVHLHRNRGKAAALNAGIARSKGEIVAFSDADSILDRQAIRHLVRHFGDPSLGAVSGRVDVLNPRSLLVAWQVLEYTLGQEVVKNAQLGSGASAMVCPGPLSAFRRTVLVELGGYKARSLAEDFDITLETIDRGYRVGYEPRALAWTQTPGSWSDLRKQRLRWYRGNLQVFSRHRRLFLNSRTGLLGLFWLPYSLLVGFGGVIFESFLLMNLPLLLWISGAPLASFAQGLVFLLLIELLGAGQYLMSLGLAGRWRWRLVSSALLVKPYHLFLAWTRLVSLWREIKKRELTWNG